MPNQSGRVGNAFLPTTLSAYDGGQTKCCLPTLHKKPPKLPSETPNPKTKKLQT